jgi:hypothetical protein
MTSAQDKNPDPENVGNMQDIRKAILTELVKATPKLLIAICAIIAIFSLRQPIAAFLDRSTEIGLGPVTLKAAEAKLKQVKLDNTDQAKDFLPDQIKTLSDRYDEALAGGKRVSVLWVDDIPQNNADLVDFLDLVGVSVVVARSYDEAVSRLEERTFNVVVSDWSREKDEIEQKAKAAREQFWGSGAQLGKLLADSGCGRKVILFSSGSTDGMPIPPGVAAQTNNYYDLLLKIADGLRGQTQRCWVGHRVQT